jgi:putative peptide maturation dehydrogenase
MLRGTLSVVPQDRLVAVSILTGSSRVLDANELRLLSEISSWEWIPSDTATERFGVAPKTIDDLLASGHLIGDSEQPELQKLREREERFATVEWDEYAFYYHMSNRTRDADPFQNMGAPAAAAIAETQGNDGSHQEYSEMMNKLSHQLRATAYQYGPAPPHFYEVGNALERRTLPDPEHDGPLFQLLRARKTVRLFDSDNPMTEQELSTVLYFTFGCHGTAPLAEGVIALKKTSPSGGALHPIEAYPIVMNVSGLQSGIYHYNVQNHRMDLLRSLVRPDSERLVEKFTAGQSYFATAHVLFILTARFHRNFWKYRKAPRSFRVIQLDAGHLSQTMALVCTSLGLGAFFTAAVNDINIEEALGIDAVEQGVVGILGCGRAVTSYALTFETNPYVPRKPIT